MAATRPFRQPRFSREAYEVRAAAGRRYSLFRETVGIASEFIQHLVKLLAMTQNRLVVLYLRVSSLGQEENGNLDEAEREARRQLAALGCTIVGVFREVAHSSIFNTERFQFEQAMNCAREQNAILVAPSRDRFLRSQHFAKTNETEPPLIYEYRTLRMRAGDVPLATLLHPDVRGRSSQTKRGQLAKGGLVGRPRLEDKGPGWTRRRKEALLPLVNARRELGWSCGRIAMWLKSSQTGYQPPTAMTVWHWLNS